MARDIIVIGASYGGVAALSELIGGIDAGIPAAIFIVLHIPPESVSTLPAILSRAGGLHAFHALDGAAIEKGRIYIAPPDHHLLIKKGHMRVVHGPRENRHRPAVDPLFRSAAVAYGPRVIGVILSGYLDDGTAGLSAIKRMGGIAIAQSLDDAIEPSMPRSATRYVKVDHILPAREIGPELTRLAQMEVDVPQDFHPPEELEREVKIEELDEGVLNDDGRYGDPSAYSCPECGGVLWEIKDGELVRFRCRVGHAFSTDAIQAEHDEALENALYTAIKTLEESATLLRRLARDCNSPSLLSRYETKIKHAESQADVIRRVLLSASRGQPEPAS
jgi:two-component system, chemotaxis family, protein-glutamate methylesterase/glutaminase